MLFFIFWPLPEKKLLDRPKKIILPDSGGAADPSLPSSCAYDDDVSQLPSSGHSELFVFRHDATPSCKTVLVKTENERKGKKGKGFLFAFIFARFPLLSLSFVACCRAISQITGRRAVPLRHLSHLFRLLLTEFHSLFTPFRF